MENTLLFARLSKKIPSNPSARIKWAGFLYAVP